MKSCHPLTAIVCAVSSTFAFMLPAHAGPLDERAAQAHLDAIAAGDVATVMQAYGDDPFVEWVGGAIDGRYRGAEAIKAAWVKFMAGNDDRPRTVAHTPFVQNINPVGVTLVANAEYVGKTTVKVRQVLVYRDGKLVTEVWQIDPKIDVGAR